MKDETSFYNIPPAAALPERLRQLRIEAGLTQEEMGKHIALNKVSVSQYENGLRKPAPQTICAYARCFNVSADYILGLTNRRIPLAGEEIAELPNYAVRIRDDALAPRNIHAGDTLFLSRIESAIPGDIVQTRVNGRLGLAIYCEIEGKPCFIYDIENGHVFAGCQEDIVGVATHVTSNFK